LTSLKNSDKRAKDHQKVRGETIPPRVKTAPRKLKEIRRKRNWKKNDCFSTGVKQRKRKRDERRMKKVAEQGKDYSQAKIRSNSPSRKILLLRKERDQSKEN